MPASGAEYNLGPVTMIPEGEGRVFRVGARDIAVFRAKAGKVYATQSLCPHKEGPLADGIIGAGNVVCPLHAYKFDLATGSPLGNDCKALLTYAASVGETGDILLSLDGQGSICSGDVEE